MLEAIVFSKSFQDTPCLQACLISIDTELARKNLDSCALVYLYENTGSYQVQVLGTGPRTLLERKQD